MVVAGKRTADEAGLNSRYPLELRDAPIKERLAVRPLNLRPGRTPRALAVHAPGVPDSVQTALADTLGADVADLVMEKSFAAAVEAAEAEEEAALTAEGQWRQWHAWTASRICYSSLEASTAGRGGGGLCTRCRLAWYATAAAQRDHWPLHKLVCALPNLAKNGRMESGACVAAPTASLGRGNPNADTAAIVYRLAHLLKTDQVDHAGDVGMRLHSFARGMMAGYPEEAWELLWAVPGMPQVLLSEPLLSRSSVRRSRIERSVGRAPTLDEEYEHELDPYGDKVLANTAYCTTTCCSAPPLRRSRPECVQRTMAPVQS